MEADLTEVGCFVVEGLSPKLVKSVHAALKTLFGKSQSEKRRYTVDKRRNPLGAGFSEYGVAKALDTGIPNLLETWDIGSDMENWPSDMITEWKLVIEYERQLYQIALSALDVIATALDMDNDELRGFVSRKNGGIHLIHYFPIPPDSPATARRQSEHCDNTLITLIPPPSPIRSGIFVFNRRRQNWQHKVIQSDQCLIQAGLLLQRLTADKILANLHTVRNPPLTSQANVSRYSTPFFLSPAGDVILKVLPRYRSQTALAKYPDTSVTSLQTNYFGRIFGMSD